MIIDTERFIFYNLSEKEVDILHNAIGIIVFQEMLFEERKKKIGKKTRRRNDE